MIDNKIYKPHCGEIPDEHYDPLIQFLHKTIRVAVKVLAVLMTLMIIWGIGDVLYVLYNRLMAPPIFLLSISDILATFGAFLAVLIAICRKVIIFCHIRCCFSAWNHLLVSFKATG